LKHKDSGEGMEDGGRKVVRDGGDVQRVAQVFLGACGGPPGGRVYHHLVACSGEIAEEAVRDVPDRRGSGEVWSLL